jgi:hypothetical protein
MKIKALVISASLPPFNDSSTLQLIGRVQRFPENGIDPIFIGPDMPGGVESGLLERLPKSSRIFRTPATPYDRTMFLLYRLPLGRLLSWVYANLMYRVAVPDVRAGWEKQVIHLCNKIWAELQPDIIVTSGGSYTAHIAGCQLARSFFVPWVADLGDPWAIADAERLFVLKSRRNRKLELETLPYASGLVFTTETTLAAYRAYLGDRLPKAIALPAYGYSVEDFSLDDLQGLHPDGHIVLSYIGTAHRGDRNLIPLIQALGALQRARALRHEFTLNIIGTHSRFFEIEAKRQRLRSVNFSERVSFQESLEWIKRSHVLLVVGNRSPLQIPAKIYPYLGSGRPILYIGQLALEEDPAVRLLAHFPGVLWVENDRHSIMEAIYQIDRSYNNIFREAIKRLSMPELRQYESTEISNRFARFVRSVYSCSKMKET